MSLPSLWPGRLIDQDFGMCITPNDFIRPFYNTYSTNYYRPWNWSMQDVVKDFGSTIDNQRDAFKVTLDVQHFRPNELSVKVVNNQILIEGRHEERRDEHGFVARQFTRRYALPNNCVPEDVVSNLSSDGVLTVIAKKSECEFEKNEKIVPIKLCKSCPLKQQINIKSNKDDTKQETGEIRNVDATKNNTQIMLKEDHCCLLLKPELLRDAAADSVDIRTETKQKEEYEQVKSFKQVGNEQVKNTSEMLQESLGKSASAGKSKQSCDKFKTAISDTAGILEQSCGKSSAMSTSAEMMEQICSKSSAAMSTSAGTVGVGQTCSKSSAAMSTTAEILEQTCGQSSATSVSTTEKVGQSSMTISQMSEQTAMSSKTSESIESSASYKSSMASSIKEMSEELTDFVCDISCSELDENKDTKK